MLCDVCNRNLDQFDCNRVSSAEFNRLLEIGFGIDPVNLELLMSTGLQRVEAIEALKAQYKKSTSDWLLCPDCLQEASETLGRNISYGAGLN